MGLAWGALIAWSLLYVQVVATSNIGGEVKRGCATRGDVQYILYLWYA